MKLTKIISLAIVSLIVVVAIISCNNNSSEITKCYRIRGSITSVADSAEICLMRIDPNNIGSYEKVCKDTLIDGKFEFFGVPDEGNTLYCICSYHEDFAWYPIYIYVKPECSIEITGDGYNMPQWRVESSHPYQKRVNEIVAQDIDDYINIGEISILYRGLYQKVMMEYEDGDKKAFDKHRDEINYFASLMSIQNNMINSNRLEYLKGLKVDEVWIDQFKIIACKAKTSYNVDSIILATCEELYQRLPAKYLETTEGKILTSELFPPTPVEVGEEMIDTTLQDKDGIEHTLSQFKGKYILLNFWSTKWLNSSPDATLTKVDEVATRYSSKLSILNITQDKREDWINAVDSLDLNGVYLNEVSQPSLLAKRYGVGGGYPANVLISPSGVVMAKWAGCSMGSIEKNIFRYLGSE